jgi:superfamily II RNA helicase
MPTDLSIYRLDIRSPSSHLSSTMYSPVTHYVSPSQGRVACEMNTCDELLAAEIILNNILEPLNPPECVGILSALICQVGLEIVR